jgi:nickel-dependent lactate racemase
MVEVWLPYGSSEIPARIPEERLLQILRPEIKSNISDHAAEVNRLVASEPELLKAAKGAERICIAIGESANAPLTSAVVHDLIEGLTSSGVQVSSIRLLRTENAPEIDSNLFPDVKLNSHDPSSSALVPAANSKLEFPVSIEPVFAEAALRIVVGELRPHHFLGYGGLSDIVFPGLASRDSVLRQLSDRRDLAVSDIRRERLELAETFTNLFALGFVLDAKLSPAAFAVGRFHECVRDLEKCVLDVYTKRVERAADIVIMSAGGKPWDQSLLDAVEMLPAAMPALKREGALVLAAECPLGHGGSEFYQWCAEHKEARHLETRLRHHFNYQGFKAAFLLRILENHRIYLVSTIPDHYVESVFGMRPAATVNSALQTVQHSLGSSSTISVVPDASRIIPVRAEPRVGK